MSSIESKNYWGYLKRSGSEGCLSLYMLLWTLVSSLMNSCVFLAPMLGSCYYLNCVVSRCYRCSFWHRHHEVSHRLPSKRGYLIKVTSPCTVGLGTVQSLTRMSRCAIDIADGKKTTSTRWFKSWPFYPLAGGHSTLKQSLNHSKKVTKACYLYTVIFCHLIPVHLHLICLLEL